MDKVVIRKGIKCLRKDEALRICDIIAWASNQGHLGLLSAQDLCSKITYNERGAAIMEFDKSRVYTALNADELGKGDVVFVADTLPKLRSRITARKYLTEIVTIEPDEPWLFNVAAGAYALAYLVAKHDDPYKEFKRAVAQGHKIWYKGDAGHWDWCYAPTFCYTVDRYSLTDPTHKEYKVFLYEGRFVYTYAEVPDGAHVYYRAISGGNASDWCDTHNKFASVAKAWEEGKQIQVKQSDGSSWEYIEQPQWHTEHEYRIKPAGLKWTDLNVGDIVRRKDRGAIAMVTHIDFTDANRPIQLGDGWYDDELLAEWEKVEE